VVQLVSNNLKQIIKQFDQPGVVAFGKMTIVDMSNGKIHPGIIFNGFVFGYYSFWLSGYKVKIHEKPVERVEKYFCGAVLRLMIPIAIGGLFLLRSGNIYLTVKTTERERQRSAKTLRLFANFLAFFAVHIPAQ
jgi:hypothetical protein